VERQIHGINSIGETNRSSHFVLGNGAASFQCPLLILLAMFKHNEIAVSCIKEKKLLQSNLLSLH